MISQIKRQSLAEALPDNSLVLLYGGKPKTRNNDVDYPFRQDSNMLLLTEVNTPGIRLVGSKVQGKVDWILYSDPLSQEEIVWGTDRVSQEELTRMTGITQVRPLESWSWDVNSLQSHKDHIFIGGEADTSLEIENLEEKKGDISLLLQELRLIKTPEEIEKIRRAIAVTHEAYDLVKANIRPGMYEYQIEALIAGVYRSHHMTEAYPTIVASGPNACVLHYTRHTRMIEEGDLVLIDFGAECDGYAADITRTFHVGDMSPRQQAVYSSVLEVKKYAESLIRPGLSKLDYQKKVRVRLNEELVKLGLIGEYASEQEAAKLSMQYYPHGVGHFLGLDVHDVGAREEIFRHGMVVTCEPGIYIREEGIGIRLEDDILVTESGCKNLSKRIPL